MTCQFCKTSFSNFSSRSICASCGVPQSVSLAEDYFSVFGLSRRFEIDRIELEKRFYLLSRMLHPDRFTGSSLEIKALSLARMSFINQAYGALKNKSSARAYLIKCEIPQQGSQKPASIPTELAEAWFELQEVILEDPAQAKTKLDSFQSELSNFSGELEKKMSTLELNYDLNPSHSLLERLEQELQTQSYIKSMERDLERLKKNAYSN
jgi:molecular chaperone HscB